MNERFILGCKINDISMQQAMQIAGTFLVGSKAHIVVTPNPEICLKASRNLHLSEVIKYADLSLPDGVGLKLGARIQGQRMHHTVTGVDFSMELFKLAHKQGYSILLLGGKGKTGTQALENITALFPGIKASYVNGGMFSEDGVPEFKDTIAKINAFNPHIILVNLGAPKQELFMQRYKNELNCKLIIGAGGTIDFLSGKVRRAPQWMRRVGLEWLWRLAQQPWRYKRIINAIILFPLACIWWQIRTQLFYRKGVVALIANKEAKLLLCKRKPRPGDKDLHEHWQLPQGGIDARENHDDAVVREMREETGLSPLRIIDRCMNCYSYKWGKQARLYMPFKGQRQHLYLLSYQGDPREVRLDDHELIDYKWVDKHHIAQLAHPLRKNVINMALKRFEKHL